MAYKEIKTSDLSGVPLDWAVAKCEGFALEYEANQKDFWIIRTNHAAQFFPPFGYLQDIFHPSSDWSQGGPIIEREKIDIQWSVYRWNAATPTMRSYKGGPAPLIAAMRCYVVSKMGALVSVPVELLKAHNDTQR